MILIVGGAGYIGSHMLKHLLDHNYDCIVLDNLVYGHKEAVDTRAHFCFADLAQKETLREIFHKFPIDAVMHFAAYTYVGESVVDPQKYYQNNVIGTLNLLEIMLENNVKKIIFSSTCATYGEPQYIPMDEKHPQNPINSYAKTKLTIEYALEDYHIAYGIEYIALRYFNAAGASHDASIGESHEPESHLIPLVLRAIKDQSIPIKVFGTDYDTIDGTCIRDYVHIEDLASAHRLALNKLGTYNGFINLGTGIGTSVKEIIQYAEEVTGQQCPVEYVGRRQGDPAQLYADNQKAKEILGWEPQYKNIKDILRTAWNWENNKIF